MRTFSFPFIFMLLKFFFKTIYTFLIRKEIKHQVLGSIVICTLILRGKGPKRGKMKKIKGHQSKR